MSIHFDLRPEEAVVGGHDEAMEDEGSLDFVVPESRSNLGDHVGQIAVIHGAPCPRQEASDRPLTQALTATLSLSI